MAPPISCAVSPLDFLCLQSLLHKCTSLCSTGNSSWAVRSAGRSTTHVPSPTKGKCADALPQTYKVRRPSLTHHRTELLQIVWSINGSVAVDRGIPSNLAGLKDDAYSCITGGGQWIPPQLRLRLPGPHRWHLRETQSTVPSAIAPVLT